MKRFFDTVTTLQEQNAATNKYREITTAIGTPLGPQISVRTHDNVISFNTLQYLGDLGVPNIMKKYLDILGQGLACSPLILQTDAVQRCEDEISAFKGFPQGSCLMLNSGYLAAKSVIELLTSQSLMVAGEDFFRNRPPVIVFIDAFTHISIQRPLMDFRKNAGPQQKVRAVVYRHLNYADLEEKMKRYADVDADKIIVTDTVFSMHGDAVDMRVLYGLAKKYDAYILLDNAHSDGVYGKEGRGFLFLEGLENIDLSIFLEVGTFSKVFACGLGGYIILPEQNVADFAKKSLESFIFAAGLPPYIAATAQEVIGIIRGSYGEQMRHHLHALSALALRELKNADFNTLDSSTHIIPIRVGDELCEIMHDRLLAKGYSVGKVYFPAIEKGQAILRIILTALYTEEHVHGLVRALREVRDDISSSAK
jgi:7-keto-8-aminopelargonate synthetase-like enzyme